VLCWPIEGNIGSEKPMAFLESTTRCLHADLGCEATSARTLPGWWLSTAVHVTRTGGGAYTGPGGGAYAGLGEPATIRRSANAQLASNVRRPPLVSRHKDKEIKIKGHLTF
jgi:hypothetical protein